MYPKLDSNQFFNFEELRPKSLDDWGLLIVASIKYT